MVVRFALTGLVLIVFALESAQAQDDGPHAYLRFASRSDHVELEKSRGALDLQKPFTAELWARWDTNVLDKMLYLAGDEAWPGMSSNVPVSATSGWAIRTSKVKDADKQAIEFIVAASARGKREWLSVVTSYQRIEPKRWQHIAVCRTPSELRIFWNGKPAARRALAGIELHSAPSNVFLGVRKDAWEDREFVGDLRAFRMSSKARYGEPFTPEVPTETDEPTVALLNLDKVEDSHAPDASGNKRHGIVVGAKLIKPK